MKLCESCTRVLPEDGICRACNGADVGTKIPEEIDDRWQRLPWSNGVVHYILKDDRGQIVDMWMCNLKGEWSHL